MGIEIEHAEILVAEGRIKEAIEKLAATLETFDVRLKEQGSTAIYDELQSRRAYFLLILARSKKPFRFWKQYENRRNDDSIFLFYLGHCHFRAKMLSKAQQELERAINLGPRPGIAFQAHGTLGMVLYELGDYLRSKKELETSTGLATPQYIKEAKIWRWLEYACRKLGLHAEARRYGQLANPS